MVRVDHMHENVMAGHQDGTIGLRFTEASESISIRRGRGEAGLQSCTATCLPPVFAGQKLLGQSSSASFATNRCVYT